VVVVSLDVCMCACTTDCVLYACTREAGRHARANKLRTAETGDMSVASSWKAVLDRVNERTQREISFRD
jgi:hypothetical protein